MSDMNISGIEIINNTREGIVIFLVKTKGNAAIGGQILVPDAGPSANWLNRCFVSNHLSNSRNQYEMFSSPLFEVVLPVLWAKYYFFNCFITLDSLE